MLRQLRKFILHTAPVETMQAAVHRLQRIHRDGEKLGKGEFIAVINDAEPEVIGVYRAIPLGTVHGGSLLQKVESFLRIKAANLKQCLQS